MSPAFVVDCSVSMTWLFSDEATSPTDELLHRLATESALVPAWWLVETANVIAIAERKGRVTTAQSLAFISDLNVLDFETDDQGPNRAFDHLLPLCRSYRLSSYDAIYLELAMRRSLPLATLDEDIRKAARKLGVPLLGK